MTVENQPQIEGYAIGKLEVKVAINLGIIALRELQKLVVTDVGARQDPHIHSHLIGILRLPPRLKEQCFFSGDIIGVKAGEAWPLAEVARVSQAEAHARLRQQRQIVVTGAADGIKTMR